MHRSSSLLLALALLSGAACASMADPSACPSIPSIRAQIRAYHADYTSASERGDQKAKRRLKGLIITADAQLAAAVKACPAATVGTITPSVVGVGDSLTITGRNFSPTPAQNVVSFTGGDTATATTASDSTLTVTVPVGALPGPVTVTSYTRPGTPSADTLAVQQPPVIFGFTPDSTFPGSVVTINGAYFSITAQENIVTFGAYVRATPTQATATALTITVPAGARSGPVSVTTNGIASVPSPSSLTIGHVTLPPRVTSFLNDSVNVCGALGVKGQNLGSFADSMVVTFEGGVTATATPYIEGDTMIAVLVYPQAPAPAPSGSLQTEWSAPCLRRG